MKKLRTNMYMSETLQDSTAKIAQEMMGFSESFSHVDMWDALYSDVPVTDRIRFNQKKGMC